MLQPAYCGYDDVLQVRHPTAYMHRLWYGTPLRACRLEHCTLSGRTGDMDMPLHHAASVYGRLDIAEVWLTCY